MSDDADHDEDVARRDRLVSAGAGVVGRGGWGVELSQGASGQGDAVRVMDEPVQNRVTKRGVADQVMPVLDRDLARDERGVRPVRSSMISSRSRRSRSPKGESPQSSIYVELHINCVM